MNITWKISNIEWIENVDEHSKVVKNVHYWVQADDEAGNRGYTWGNIQLNTDNITNFVDFDNLTEETVLTWAKAAIEETYPEDDPCALMEHSATTMCAEADPLRKRGIGVPW